MLDSKIAHDVIFEGLSLGADFVDLFIEKNQVASISYLDQKVKDIQNGTDFGVGVRVVFGDKALYGYSNQSTQVELVRITRLLCAMDKTTANGKSFQFGPLQNSNIHTFKFGLNEDIPLEQKIDFLRKVDIQGRKTKSITQMDIGSMQRMQEVEIYNSDGLHVQDIRHYTRLRASAIATSGSDQATGFHGPGAFSGWELTERVNPEELADYVTKQAIVTLNATPCPAGKMPIVIDSGFGGVIFHEACGHSLETTSVQKKASVFHDRMGEMIANPAVSAVDDGTMKNEWGSINYDDEGTKTQKTQLIKDGKLTSFLVDKMGEIKTGYKSTGSGRKQSYKFAPASRMRNTFIEPGKHTLEEMISTMPNGIYAKSMGGGSVNPGTGEFNFSVQEGYLVKDGKIGEAIKGATLIGTGEEILKQISMVGNNFEQAAGMCGSVSGAVPTNVGQAALKVDNILVGGNA